MKIVHVTESYVLKDDVPAKDIYRVAKGLKDYKRFLHVLKSTRPDIVHMHTVGKETFGIYALIARINRIKVVRTLNSPLQISYWYTVKQLCIRFFFSHSIVTSKYDLQYIDKFHITARTKRSLVYKGVDEKKLVNLPKKEASRLHIYKKLGISFTKNIRAIGTIIGDDIDTGIEHLIDAAYLADKYKNLTNTVFMILSKGIVSKEIKDQIAELHVEGICLVIEHFENPEEYIHAFDIYISPRTKAGDIYTLLQSIYMQVPIIATKVGDTKELDTYVAAPLVPTGSAKFLTEAVMHVIKNENPLALKLRTKSYELPKKFSMENEFISIHEIYSKVLKRTTVNTRKLNISE